MPADSQNRTANNFNAVKQNSNPLLRSRSKDLNTGEASKMAVIWFIASSATTFHWQKNNSFRTSLPEKRFSYSQLTVFCVFIRCRHPILREDVEDQRKLYAGSLALSRRYMVSHCGMAEKWRISQHDWNLHTICKLLTIIESHTTTQRGQRTEPASTEIWFAASQWSRVFKMKENYDDGKLLYGLMKICY